MVPAKCLMIVIVVLQCFVCAALSRTNPEVDRNVEKKNWNPQQSVLGFGIEKCYVPRTGLLEGIGSSTRT